MRSLARVALLSTVSLAVASSLATVPAAAFAAAESAVFTFTGATQVFTVPEGVTSVVITADGGRGGRSVFDPAFGGAGGFAEGTFTVTPGEVLTVTVGGDAGSAGDNCGGYSAVSCGGYGAGRGGHSRYGGGGGGASAVTTAGGALLVVAGGGGGAGAGDYCPNSDRSNPGPGGPAGHPGGTAQPCVDYDFRYTLNGGGGGAAGTADAAGTGGGGGGGTATDPACFVGSGSGGAAGSGADGGASFFGGGGGGGWRGGGSGGQGAYLYCESDYSYGSAGAGGGGGGSSRVAPTGTNPSVGISGRALGANGQVVISWDAADNSPPVITSGDEATFTVGTAGSFTVTTMPGHPTETALTVSGSLPSGVSFTDMGDGTATLAGTPASGTAGSYPLTISAANSAGSADQAFTLTVGAAAQTITFATLTDTTYGAAPFALSATATSGLPVTFTSDTATVCTVTGSTVTLHAAGSCIVIASQAGNSDWQPASPVARSFTVRYVITDLAPPNKSVFKSGSRIPVKFQLAGADGTPIPDSVAAGLGCTVQVALNTATPVCATYNATTDQFQANLSTTGTRSGSTNTITIIVTAGTTIVANSTVTVTAR